MAVIHLIEGPVGAGKTTFAAQLRSKHKAAFFNLDDWMTTLFQDDRPSTLDIEWYLERKYRCIEQIWKLACEILETGSDVILELGLIQIVDRKNIYDRADATDYELIIYVLEAPRDVRKDRVRNRNRAKEGTYSMDVPEHIFEIASDMWEPVHESECHGYELAFISTEL